MTQYICYDYNSDGFITGTNRSDWPDDHPDLRLQNRLVLKSAIPATMTITHSDGKTETIAANVMGGGWAFVLDEKGNPTQDGDGNYILTPPEQHIPDPDINTHIFVGLVKSGSIDVANVKPGLLNEINWSLDKAGFPPVENTQVAPLPERTAVTDSASLVVDLKG